MEGYMTIKEAAEQWNVSWHQVQMQGKKKRISEVYKVRINDMIPAIAKCLFYGFFYQSQFASTDNCDAK